MTEPTAASAFGEPGTAAEHGLLPPVAHRNRWIAGGLALQLAGAALPAAVLLHRAKSENLLHHVDGLTVKLVWHQAIHHSSDLAAIIAGVVLFVAGSMVLARPFVRSPLTLVLAVPLAALAFVVALGALALIVAIVALLIWMALDSGDFPWTPSTANVAGTTKRKKRTSQ